MMSAEIFTFLLSAYDISLARRIVAQRPPGGTIPVRPYYEGVIGAGIVAVDEAYALSDAVDISQPVIAGTFHDGTTMVLDGYHRITRAYREGHATLRCCTLSAAETNQITLIDQGPCPCTCSGSADSKERRPSATRNLANN